jgi:D-alanyl-D-alanine carboxypeptidase/D-alanyl-D-alanine-endopeptidase (penicillin-binding protein 4)
MDALSIAGTDGTLRNRFRESPLTRLVRAKTGTMSGVSCISGYMKTRRGNLLAVSIMMNGCTGPAKPYQNAQDEIVKTLWENY